MKSIVKVMDGETVVAAEQEIDGNILEENERLKLTVAAAERRIISLINKLASVELSVRGFNAEARMIEDSMKK